MNDVDWLSFRLNGRCRHNKVYGHRVKLAVFPFCQNACNVDVAKQVDQLLFHNRRCANTFRANNEYRTAADRLEPFTLHPTAKMHGQKAISFSLAGAQAAFSKW